MDPTRSDDTPPPRAPNRPRSLEDLDARLKKARGESEKTPTRERKERGLGQHPAALAFRVGMELVSAFAVGLGIGWLLDRWLGTAPWLMVVFILLGGAAGILNVIRVAGGYDYSAGYKKTKMDEDTGDSSGKDVE